MTTTERTTIEQLAELVENYYGLEKRIAKLGATKEMTEKLILEAFALTGMSVFRTPSGLIASVIILNVNPDGSVVVDKSSLVVLRVSQSEARHPSSHSLDTQRFFQSQG